VTQPPQSDAVGLVLARPARLLGIEPFFMEFIAGVEETLATEGRSLLLHVVHDHEAEIRAYRRWAQGGMVAAVVVVNIATADERLAVLQELGLPTIVVGGPDRAMPFAHVWIDNGGAMHESVAYLVGLGHRRIARVSGPATLAHTHTRTEAFLAECEARGATGTVVEGDYSEESGARATRTLLGRGNAPSAIIYDNDVMAVGGLAAAHEMQVDVPGSLSLLAWDDSALCRLSRPALSAMSLDVHAMGALVGDCVLNLLADGPATVHVAPPLQLVVRGTTAAPPEAATPTAPPATAAAQGGVDA
jgi:DNA-binding LacI/PurR family transcriptional regulator